MCTPEVCKYCSCMDALQNTEMLSKGSTIAESIVAVARLFFARKRLDKKCKTFIRLSQLQHSRAIFPTGHPLLSPIQRRQIERHSETRRDSDLKRKLYRTIMPDEMTTHTTLHERMYDPGYETGAILKKQLRPPLNPKLQLT